MAHGDAVANTDNRKLHRNTAGFPYSVGGSFGYGIQMYMPRNNFAPGYRNTDQGPFKFFVNKPHGLKQRPVGGFSHAFINNITAHVFSS
jgi:hypothetical protein